jgi:uncharacterized protein YkwD
LPPEAQQFNQYTQPVKLAAAELQLTALVSQWAREVQHEPPALDAGLTYACRSLALRMKMQGGRQVGAISNAEIQTELVRFGVADSAVRTQMVAGTFASSIGDEMRGTIREELARGRYTHFGVGVARALFPPVTYAALVLSRRPIAIDPFPKWIATGERVALSGRLLEGLNKPTVYVNPPSGHVYEALLDVAPDGAFHTTIFFGYGAGLHRIEVSGVGSSGPEIAALMPVQVGNTEPAAEATPVAPENSEDEARQLVFAQINRERVEAGLSPVQVSPALERVAQSHAEEMRRMGYVAHRSPTTGMASDRATAAGIRWSRITENVAVNQSALSAHAGLMDSPAHRTNVLDGAVRFIGIGVAFSDRGSGQRAVFLVENYVSLQHHE